MSEITFQLLRLTMPLEADLLFSASRFRMSVEMEDHVRELVRNRVDWIRLIRLASRHETLALLHRNLRRICPEEAPPSVLEPLTAICWERERETRERTQELVRILGALEDRGIFAVAYKGPVLAQRLYGDPSLRDFSKRTDLDIMIRERDLPTAQKAILDQGYRLAFPLPAKIDEYAHTHRELHFRCDRDGPRMLELHWRFSALPACIRHDPERFLKRFERISLVGASVRSLPLEAYVLVLSLHAAKHKWKKLKLICDIAEILQMPDVDWAYALHQADRLGLKRILAVSILLAQEPLNVEMPEALKGRLQIDAMARSVAEECRGALLEEPDDDWVKEAGYDFFFRLRERLRDRTNMSLRFRLLPRFTPDERDRRLVRVPDSLAAFYYLVRPARMAWEKITGRELSAW